MMEDADKGEQDKCRAFQRELSFSNAVLAARADPLVTSTTQDTSLESVSFSFENTDQESRTSHVIADEHEPAGEFWQRKNDEFRKQVNDLGSDRRISEDKSSEFDLFEKLDIQIPSDDELEREFGSYSDLESIVLSNKEKKKMLEQEDSLMKTIAVTLFYILAWYTFSTCLTLYNKLLLGDTYGNFPAPLLMNTIHFSMQAIVSTLLLKFCCPSLRPSISMSWIDYFMKVVPTAVATALDVDLTNASLVFISVSFATMCKSATPVFLLFFAFLFRLEKPSVKLFAIISIISVGVLLTVAKETEFKVSGFILVMLAAASSGFRWVVTQMLLQKEEYGLSNPVAVMSYLTPVMALVTMIFSLILEPWNHLARTAYFDTSHHIFRSCLLMLLGGTIAFLMVMTEYLLISKTSAVTMTVAGVVKEVVTITAAVIYFGDQFTVLRGVGMVVIIIGVALFNVFKYQSLQEPIKKDGAEHGIEFNTKYTILEDEEEEL